MDLYRPKKWLPTKQKLKLPTWHSKTEPEKAATSTKTEAPAKSDKPEQPEKPAGKEEPKPAK